MESLFVWIVMSAGVAIALLGAVLFTSERELKTRRREVEELVTKLENMQQGNAPAPDNSAALAELRAANQELQNQIRGLTNKLETSRRTVEELELTQRSHASDQGEPQQLHAANEQLKMELNEVRAQLHASEAQLQGSAEIQHDSSQQQIAQARAEVGALREQLNDSQAKIRELENARQNQVDIDALEARHRQERQSLGARRRDGARNFGRSGKASGTRNAARSNGRIRTESKKPARGNPAPRTRSSALAGAHRGSRRQPRATRGAAKTLQRVTFQTCIAGRNAARAPAGFIVSRSVDGRTVPRHRHGRLV